MLSMLTRPVTQLLSNRQLKSTSYLVCNSLWDAKSKLRSFEGRHVGNTCVLVPSLTALNKFLQEDWTCEHGRNESCRPRHYHKFNVRSVGRIFL